MVTRSFPAVSAPDYPLPRSVREWKTRRGKSRKILESLLGDLPPRPRRVRATCVSRENRTGYRLEKIVLDNGAGAEIPAHLLVPKGKGPFPAILYLHWHGEEYGLGKDNLFRTAPDRSGRCGEAMVRRGYVVFAPDAYAFGERQGRGPGGTRETGKDEEMTLSKTFLWMGRTLWGMIVRDDRIALDYLLGRPEVDPRRVGTTGFSMGSTRTWWLAALDDRIAAAVGVCCLTRYQDLIRAGALREHGIYYFVPGMLRHFDTEAVASLIAPRPFMTLSGAKDGGSPLSGVRTINAFCAATWRRLGRGDRFRGVVSPGVGHVYTAKMWREMLAWFDRHLRKI